VQKGLGDELQYVEGNQINAPSICHMLILHLGKGRSGSFKIIFAI
jgi:hypothetical protein